MLGFSSALVLSSAANGSAAHSSGTHGGGPSTTVYPHAAAASRRVATHASRIRAFPWALHARAVADDGESDAGAAKSTRRARNSKAKSAAKDEALLALGADAERATPLKQTRRKNAASVSDVDNAAVASDSASASKAARKPSRSKTAEARKNDTKSDAEALRAREVSKAAEVPPAKRTRKKTVASDIESDVTAKEGARIPKKAGRTSKKSGKAVTNPELESSSSPVPPSTEKAPAKRSRRKGSASTTDPVIDSESDGKYGVSQRDTLSAASGKGRQSSFDVSNALPRSAKQVNISEESSSSAPDEDEESFMEFLRKTEAKRALRGDSVENEDWLLDELDEDEDILSASTSENAPENKRRSGRDTLRRIARDAPLSTGSVNGRAVTDVSFDKYFDDRLDFHPRFRDGRVMPSLAEGMEDDEEDLYGIDEDLDDPLESGQIMDESDFGPVAGEIDEAVNKRALRMTGTLSMDREFDDDDRDDDEDEGDLDEDDLLELDGVDDDDEYEGPDAIIDDTDIISDLSNVTKPAINSDAEDDVGDFSIDDYFNDEELEGDQVDPSVLASDDENVDDLGELEASQSAFEDADDIDDMNFDFDDNFDESTYGSNESGSGITKQRDAASWAIDRAVKQRQSRTNSFSGRSVNLSNLSHTAEALDELIEQTGELEDEEEEGSVSEYDDVDDEISLDSAEESDEEESVLVKSSLQSLRPTKAPGRASDALQLKDDSGAVDNRGVARLLRPDSRVSGSLKVDDVLMSSEDEAADMSGEEDDAPSLDAYQEWDAAEENMADDADLPSFHRRTGRVWELNDDTYVTVTEVNDSFLGFSGSLSEDDFQSRLSRALLGQSKEPSKDTKEWHARELFKMSLNLDPREMYRWSRRREEPPSSFVDLFPPLPDPPARFGKIELQSDIAAEEELARDELGSGSDDQDEDDVDDQYALDEILEEYEAEFDDEDISDSGAEALDENRSDADIFDEEYYVEDDEMEDSASVVVTSALGNGGIGGRASGSRRGRNAAVMSFDGDSEDLELLEHNRVYSRSTRRVAAAHSASGGSSRSVGNTLRALRVVGQGNDLVSVVELCVRRCAPTKHHRTLENVTLRPFGIYASVLSVARVQSEEHWERLCVMLRAQKRIKFIL